MDNEKKEEEEKKEEKKEEEKEEKEEAKEEDVGKEGRKEEEEEKNTELSIKKEKENKEEKEKEEKEKEEIISAYGFSTFHSKRPDVSYEEYRLKLKKSGKCIFVQRERIEDEELTITYQGSFCAFDDEIEGQFSSRKISTYFTSLGIGEEEEEECEETIRFEMDLDDPSSLYFGEFVLKKE